MEETAYRKDDPCPLRDALNRVGDKWSVLAILALSEGTYRFGELRRHIGGISQRMLTETLRGLERDGLVHRHVIPTVPVAVEYSLTEIGHALLAPLRQIEVWAEAHQQAITDARAEYAAREAPLHSTPTPPSF